MYAPRSEMMLWEAVMFGYGAVYRTWGFPGPVKGFWRSIQICQQRASRIDIMELRAPSRCCVSAATHCAWDGVRPCQRVTTHP